MFGSGHLSPQDGTYKGNDNCGNSEFHCDLLHCEKNVAMGGKIELQSCELSPARANGADHFLRMT